MSSPRFLTPGLIALLSACLLLGAGWRASAAGGLVGVLGVVKVLGTPAEVAAALLGVELISRAMPSVQLPPGLLVVNRRILFCLIGLVDLVLLTVIVLGVPFLAVMTR